MIRIKSIPEVLSCYVKSDRIENMTLNNHSPEKIFNITNSKYSNIIPNIIVHNSHINDASITLKLNRENYKNNQLLDSTIIYNYTDTTIYVRSKNNFPVRIDPLPDSILEHIDKSKKGQIDIFTIYPVFNSNLALEGTEILDYITEMEKVVRSENSPYEEYEEIKLVLSYMREHSRNIHNYLNSSSLIGKNNINLNSPIYYLNVLVKNSIDINEIYTVKANGDIYVENKEILISIKHPNKSITMKEVLADRVLLDKITKNLLTDDIEGLCIYIVDTEHKLTSRYINILGEVKKIYSTDKPYKKLDGLYIEKFSKQQDVLSVADKPIATIDEIDNLNYIFKSKEEAINGTDKDIINKINLNTLEQDVLLLRKQLELEKTKLDFDKQDFEREKNNYDLLKLQQEKEIRDKDTEINKIKYVVDKNKHKYENKKYKRDTTVESVKTGALVLSTLISVFVLYKNTFKN